MNEYQYTNPFFIAGRVAAEIGETRNDCPYDYLKVEEQHVATEHYRQKEWYAGFNSYKGGTNEKAAG